MNERLLLAVLLAMACAPAQAWREEPLTPSAPSMPAAPNPILLSEQMTDLSLLDAVFLGLRNNRSIKSAYLWRVADKFDLRVAEDVFSPKLYLSSNYRASRSSEDRERRGEFGATTTLLSEYGTLFSLGWNNNHSEANEAGWRRNDGVDFSIIQPLLRGAGREVTTAPRQLARLTEQANRLGLKANISQTVSTIIYTYRDLLRAQEQLRIAKAALQRSRELLEVNRAMIQAGRMAEFDAVQTEASLATQELSVEEAANQVDTSRLDLLRLLALDLSSPVRASDTLQAEAIAIDPSLAIRLAEQQQPDYLRQLIQRQQADINLLLAKNQSQWDLSVELGANQARDRYGSSNDSGGERRWDSYAGLRLNIPIGDLSRRQGEVHARINVEDQQLQLEESRQALIRNVKDVVRDLGTRWRQYEIAQRGVELSQRKLSIERDKLAAGRSSNFQVLSFESDLQNAENARLNALIAYLNAQTQLDLTLGMTLESWEIIINDH